MTAMTLKIGPVLRATIEKRRLTLKEISRGTGVPATTIAEWANNRAPKNPLHLQRVADFLGLTIHYLLFGEEDRSEPLTKLIREDFFSGTFEITIKRVKIK